MISQHNIHTILCFRRTRSKRIDQSLFPFGLRLLQVLYLSCSLLYQWLQKKWWQKRWFKDREITWTKLRMYRKIFVCMMINRMRSSHGSTTSADEELLVFWYQWLQGLYIQSMMRMTMRDLYFFWLLSVASNVIFLSINNYCWLKK